MLESVFRSELTSSGGYEIAVAFETLLEAFPAADRPINIDAHSDDVRFRNRIGGVAWCAVLPKARIRGKVYEVAQDEVLVGAELDGLRAGAGMSFAVPFDGWRVLNSANRFRRLELFAIDPNCSVANFQLL